MGQVRLAAKTSPPNKSVDVSRVQRRTLVVLVIMQVVGTVGVGISPSIGVLLAGEVTDSESLAGLARASSTLGAAIFGLPLGNLAARFGRRFALTSGWWVAAAGSLILVAAAQGELVVPLFAGLLLIGAGSAVSLQSRFAATDLADSRQKGRALSLIVWVGTIGMVLGPNLGVPGEFVGGEIGLNTYAAAFLIAGACLAIAGAIVFIGLRPDPLAVGRHLPGEDTSPTTDSEQEAVRPSRDEGESGVKLTLDELKSNQPARVALLAILTAQIVMVAIMTMTPVHIAHNGGSISVVGLTISLHILGMYGLAPFVGYLYDRIGSRVTIGIGIAIFVVSTLIGALGHEEIVWIVASLILLGIGWSFVNVAGSAQFSSVISGDLRASAQGGADALSNLCGAVAAVVAGPLLVFSSFSVLSIVGMVALMPLAWSIVRRPESRSSRRDEAA